MLASVRIFSEAMKTVTDLVSMILAVVVFLFVLVLFAFDVPWLGGTSICSKHTCKATDKEQPAACASVHTEPSS